MVTLTRMTGGQFALNPDLIERVDSTPDTVITLVDGTKYLVLETLDEVVSAVLEFRARVLAHAAAFENTGPSWRRRLSAVTDEDAESSAPVLPIEPRRS
jgi:flagellar protein FlbD